jgi:O-acetyl-ADP-ribose deacetylase (regulator of RNase III)
VIRVVVADLAAHPADAVVLPATILLEATTPTSRRLSERGGERFARDRRVSEELAVGAAVVTGGGDLSTEFVIHAVIQRTPDEAVTAKWLRRAWLSALERAQQWEFQRLAAPLLGSGAGNLKAGDAIAVMLDAWNEHHARAPLPAEISIVVETEEDRAVLEEAMSRVKALE